MDDEARLEQVALSQTTQPKFRPYYSLLWFSRRLGKAATQPLTGMRHILHEVKVPTREQLIGTHDPIGIRKRQKPVHPSDSLQHLVERSHEVLARSTTIFPFTIFPDTVVVDRTKVTIIQKNFFWSEDVVSIRIEDVLNTTVSTNFMFGSLNVSSRVMNSTDHYRIKFFWKADAMHLKHLIQGSVIAQHNNIQVSHLSKNELIKTLCELGNDTRS